MSFCTLTTALGHALVPFTAGLASQIAVCLLLETTVTANKDFSTHREKLFVRLLVGVG